METNLGEIVDLMFYFEKEIDELCSMEESKLSGLLVQEESPLRYNSTIGKAPEASFA